MAMVNIPTTVDDPNYRYKMPRLRAKVEGRGNGIRTNITNMADVAKHLKRPAEYVTKFCGQELCSQSKFESREGKAIVNGAHAENVLQALIDKFIEKFVACPHCHLPEINILVRSERVTCQCNACGFAGELDNLHKLCSYIVKNPPTDDCSTIGGKKPTSKKTREERQRERAEKTRKQAVLDDDDSDNMLNDDGLDEATTATTASKKDRKRSSSSETVEKISRHTSSKTKDSSSKTKEKDKEKDDKSKDPHHHHHKHKKHHKVSGDQAGPADYGSDEIKSVIERLVIFLKDQSRTPADFFQEVRVLQVSQQFDATMRVFVVFGALFPDGKIEADLVSTKLPFIKSVCDRSVSGSKIIQALEQYMDKLAPNSWGNFGFVLSSLYQGDVVEERSVMDYYDDEDDEEDDAAKAGEKKNVNPHKRGAKESKNFRTWLESAETESDSDENDEDDDDNGDKKLARDGEFASKRIDERYKPLTVLQTAQAKQIDTCSNNDE